MNQEELMKQVVAQVMQAMGNVSAGESKKTVSTHSAAEKVTKDQYPLSEKIPERVKTPTGISLSDLKYEDVISGKIGFEDLKITPESLEMQAEVAESVRREPFAVNMRRAAELISVPDDRLLEMYNALRPYRSTKEELLAIADELEFDHNAPVCAQLIRDAADIYEKRDRLKKF